MSTSERKDVRYLEKLSKHRAAQDAETIIAICRTEPGRRWYWDQLSAANIFTTTFTGDALSGAFNEGQRSAGLRLLSQLQGACPEQFVAMMKEANARRTLDDRAGSDPHARAGADYPEPDVDA